MAEPTGFMKTLNDLDNNPNVALGIAVFLAVYAAILAPMLPDYALSIFDNPIFRLLAFLVIAYTASKNPVIAILGGVAMLVSLNTLQDRRKAVPVVVPMPVQKEVTVAEEEAVEGMEVEDLDYEGDDYESADYEQEVTTTPVGMPGYAMPRPDRDGQGAPVGVSEAGCPSPSAFQSAGWPQYASMDASSETRQPAAEGVLGYNISDERFKYAGV